VERDSIRMPGALGNVDLDELFHEPEGRVPIPCASSLWWGEATDEPAREDARPTNRFMAPMRVRCWTSKPLAKAAL